MAGAAALHRCVGDNLAKCCELRQVCKVDVHPAEGQGNRDCVSTILGVKLHPQAIPIRSDRSRLNVDVPGDLLVDETVRRLAQDYKLLGA